MCPRGEGVGRAGAALLPVVATVFTLALVVATLASVERAGLRAARAAASRASAAALADAARDSAVWLLRAGRGPGLGGVDTLVAAQRADTVVRAIAGRPAWDHVVLRIEVVHGAGGRGVVAGARRRLDLPLDVPLPMPVAPLTGGRPWSHAGAVLLALDDDGAAPRRCRDTLPAAPVPAVAVASPPPSAALLAHPEARRIDPDTVAAPLVGIVRLPPGATLAAPLVVDGVLLGEGDLVVAAPLRVRGVIVVAGSVETRGGGALRLDGAAWAGDAGGGTSRLGAGDTVRWNPCAVRAARARLARSAEIAAWEVARDR